MPSDSVGCPTLIRLLPNLSTPVVAWSYSRDTKDVINRWTVHAQLVKSSVDHHRQARLTGHGIAPVLGDEVALSG